MTKKLLYLILVAPVITYSQVIERTFEEKNAIAMKSLEAYDKGTPIEEGGDFRIKPEYFGEINQDLLDAHKNRFEYLNELLI